MTTKAAASDIAALTRWSLDAAGKSLHRQLKFADFNEAWGFMN